MKKLSVIAMMLIMLLVALSSCSDDDNPTNSGISIQGTWDVTEYKYISQADPTVTFDFLTEFGASFTMTVSENGAYTMSGTVQGVPFSFSGNFSEDSNGDISADDPNTTVTVTNNTITMVSTDESWDFNEDGTDEPANLRVVMTKR